MDELEAHARGLAGDGDDLASAIVTAGRRREASVEAREAWSRRMEAHRRCEPRWSGQMGPGR